MKFSMQRRVLIGLALLAVPPVAVHAQVPGANINVSNLAGAQSETGIAINPTNPQNLVSVSNNLLDLSRLGVWFSTDGGATWTASFIDENQDGFGGGDSRFDPNVAFDSDGNVYVVYSTTGTGNRLLVASSTDGGQNFNQVTTVTTDTATANNLHTAMILTRSDGGPATPDDVLVLWARVQAGGESIEAALSLDAGASFTVTNNMINDALQRTFLPWGAGDLAGDFQVVWEVNQGGGAGAIFHDSLDGTTLASGTDNQVSTVQITDFAAATSKIPAQPDRGIFSVTTIDVDRVTGRLLVSYTDRPNTSSNDTDIYVRFSDDGGANWSARTQINDDGTTTSQFLPRMAIDQNNHIGLVWYDARNDTTNNQQVDLYVSISTDGGVSWSANQLVTTAASDESTANAARNVNNYGEYLGAIALGGATYAAWTDARAANFTASTNEDVETATVFVDVPPVCDANGPYTAECAVENVTLDGSASNDPDGGPLIYTWEGPFTGSPVNGVSPSVVFPGPTGAKAVQLTVLDDELDSTMCSAPVTVQDTLDPTISAPADVTAECAAPEGTAVALGTPIVGDACDANVDYVNDAPALFPLGTTTVTWTATDDDGNSAMDVQLVTIEDTLPPIISCNSAATIIPPDAPISFTASAVDQCAGPLTPVITAYDCYTFTKKGRRIDKTSSCQVALSGDTVTILDSGGVGDRIEWTVEADDGNGNIQTETCTLEVINPTS
jgi:hypothetical protein